MQRWAMASFPEFVHETRISKTFSRVIWTHHSWVQASVFGRYDPMYPRYVRGMVKSIEVLWLMCAEAVVVFIISYQDFGCDRFGDFDCHKKPHPHDPSLPMCEWDAAYYPACFEFQPSPSDT